MMKPHYAIFEGQSNVACGPRIYPSGADTSGKEAHLAQLAAAGGELKADVPAAEADDVHAVIGEGGAERTTVFFPAPGDMFRLKLTGACSAGDELKTAGDGTVQTAGAGAVYAIAEEVGVAGQLVLCRKS